MPVRLDPITGVFRHELVLQHLLRTTPEGGRALELPEALAERTVEIDVVPETTQPQRFTPGEHHQKLLLPDWLGCPKDSAATSHA